MKGRYAAYILPVAFLAVLWTSCSDEQLFPGNARMKTAFRLTSSDAANGSIAIQQAYLKLERISVTGRLGDKNTPEANYVISQEDPPFRLSQGDTAQISLTLPTRVYDEMDLHLFLLRTDYELIIHQNTTEEPPAPDDDDEPGGVTDPGAGDDHDGATGDNDDNDGDESDGDGADDEDDDQEHDDGDDDDSDQNEDEDRDDDDDRDEHQGTDDRDDDNKNDNDKNKGKNKGKGNDKKNGGDDRTVGSEVNSVVDLDHFFQHAKPSLVVFATWTVNGETINVVFAVTDVERVTIRAMQNDESRIMLDEHGRGTVNFDPQRWFESISTTDLQNASLQTYQGQPVMFIHRDVNSALFETLLNNLVNSATLEVSVPSGE